VEFTPAPGGAPRISVTAYRGTANVTLAQGDACLNGHPFPLPATKTYRLEFEWDGHGYKPTAASEATAKLFAGE